jgi:hypothetical protein
MKKKDNKQQARIQEADEFSNHLVNSFIESFFPDYENSEVIKELEELGNVLTDCLHNTNSQRIVDYAFDHEVSVEDVKDHAANRYNSIMVYVFSQSIIEFTLGMKEAADEFFMEELLKDPVNKSTLLN